MSPPFHDLATHFPLTGVAMSTILTWTTFSTGCLPESTFPFFCLYSFMFLNSALCFHGLVPAETFHEAELIVCVCAEAVSIKKRAEINTRTFWVIENWQGGCRTRLKSNLQNTPTVSGCPWIKHLICYKPSRSHPPPHGRIKLINESCNVLSFEGGC